MVCGSPYTAVETWPSSIRLRSRPDSERPMHRLPDGSGFFIAEVPDGPNLSPPVKWNPWNKVVQDHRDGTIHHEATNEALAVRGLLTPWHPGLAETEPFQPPVF